MFHFISRFLTRPRTNATNAATPCPTQCAVRKQRPSGRKDLALFICVDCSRRHLELSSEPGVFGLTGAAI
jgi:hypothetical protein